MGLYLEEEGRESLKIDWRTIAGDVVEEALDYEGCPYETELELLLTDNEGIKVLNREYRDIDKETDVLSFPMVDFDSPADYEFLEQEERYFNPETGELVLGNIVISKERVIRQAVEYGHSQEREYAFLIAHSMLHLLGYDHLEEEDRLQMEDRQEAILKKLHILR